MAVLALGWILMPIFGLGQAEPVGSPVEAEREPFAGGRDGPAGAKPVAIDGKRVMKYLEAVCDIGPRMSGTNGMRKQQELLKKHFEDLGAKVVLQTFTARQRSRSQPVEMANMIISWHPDRARRVILCSHYDTRPIADQEPDPRKWREKFVSANDGGSGVALLMELGHHMKALKTNVGVDFVFFDGEEYIFDPRRDKYFFGSENFAQEYRKSKPRLEYTGAILFDMIAGQNARFPAEGNSWIRSGPLVKEIWGLAAELRCAAFVNRIGDRVQDDHLALQAAGIPAIDIIDFSYPHWHRLSDVPDNCAPETMEQVARVVSVWLQKTK
jgi:hypothetical protein